MAFYRYLGELEHAEIVRVSPHRVPNRDRYGRPKVVYFTHDLYTTVSDAEIALMIGTLNPTGATHPPAYRAEIDLTGIGYTSCGIVAGGTGSEYTTTGSPAVVTLTGIY